MYGIIVTQIFFILIMETPQGQEGSPNQSPYSERVMRTIEFMKVMESAEKEAREHNHERIRTEDLLLGLMYNPFIKNTLLKFHIDLDRVRESIRFIFGTGEKRTSGVEIRLSIQAKRVIEIAGAGKFDFQTETPLIDLLRAIIIEQKGRGAQILESLKVGKDNLPEVIRAYNDLKGIISPKK